MLKNVEFGLKQLCRRGQLAQKQIHSLSHEVLQLVGLAGMEKRYPHELSGGQQQRVALARALAPRPPLILLDEPFSNLDVQVRLYLRQEVRDILKSIGASGIFVTHDQEEALAISDKVAVMQAGRLIQLDTPENIYQNPVSRFIAEFVTQANFLPAVQTIDGWQTEIGRVSRLGRASRLGCGNSAKRGDLMVAQEDLQIAADEAGTAVIQGRQFLGRVYQYKLVLPSSQVLQVRADSTQRLSVGTRVRVTIKADRARFFSSEDLPVARVAQVRQKSVA